MSNMTSAHHWIYNRLGKKQMRRSMWAKIVIVRFLACSWPLLTIVSGAHAEDNPSNTRELLVPVVEALRMIEKPQTGRGSAVLKRHDYTGVNERHITFVFKDELSRTDTFEYSDGKRGKRIGARAMGPRVYVGFNPNNASVLPSPAKDWHRELGHDFHPDTFSNINHYSIADLIQRLIRGPAKMSVELDDRGLLKIKSEYRDEKVESEKLYWLDKAKGFRLVLYKRTKTELESGETKTSLLQMSWKQYGRIWYIDKAEYELGPAYYYKMGEVPRVKRPYTWRVEFVMEDFAPDVDVDDSEFTLNGLDLPEGIPVIDKIGGGTYRYGNVPLMMADIEKPLAQAEFPAAITGRIQENGDKTSVDSGAPGQTPSPNDVNSEPGGPEERISSGRNKTVLVIAIGALVALALLLTGKYLHFRRGHTK